MNRKTAVLLLALAAGACAPVRPAAPAPSTYAYSAAVEVHNTASFPVVVRYYRQGGPFYLGTVGANQKQRLVLPHPDVDHVFAETESGRRLGRQPGVASPVHIRRVAPEATE